MLNLIRFSCLPSTKHVMKQILAVQTVFLRCWLAHWGHSAVKRAHGVFTGSTNTIYLVSCDLNRKFNHLPNFGRYALHQTIDNRLVQTRCHNRASSHERSSPGRIDRFIPRLSKSKTFSIGLISGERAGYRRTWMPAWVLKALLNSCDKWHYHPCKQKDHPDPVGATMEERARWKHRHPSEFMLFLCI